MPRDFAGLLELEPHGADTFVGLSPPYDWGRIFGGQVIAQALWAAAATVPAERSVHSLHAYFILADAPMSRCGTRSTVSATDAPS